MTNRILKLLSIFVSLVLIINLLPLQALASDIDETPQLPLSTLPEDGSSGSTTGYQRLDTATVVEEDTSRRGEYYKEFVLNNGLRLAAVYADPVHFEEDGQWKDIDNTLKAVNIKGVSGYTNTAGVWQVHFPQQLTGSNAISVTKDGYTVSFGMAGELTNSGNIAVASIGASSDILAVSSVRSSAAQIRAVDLTEQKAAAQYEQTVLEKHHSQLAYSSVYDNTEVVYDLTGSRLKESIVISKYDASLWGYRYNLNTGGLIPVLLEDNTIELRHPETAEVIMTMPAPFMVDANDEYSYDVDVSLAQKNGGYLLSYYVPRAWLASSDRVWPVVLDPVVDASSGSSNIQDISFTPTVTETYRHSTLKVGYSTSNGAYRTYLRFVDLPLLGNADYIVKATVAMYKPTTSTKSIPVEVHSVSQTWTDRTISPGINNTINEIVEDYVIAQNAGWYQWDITGIARGWYDDPSNSLADNTGLMFKATEAIETGGVSNWHQFCSSNYADNVEGVQGSSPRLAIVFRNMNGLESYWDYTSSSAGRAGTGYVNNYTGNLVWVRNDIGFGGNRMPVSISHIYNTGEASSNIRGLGFGWRTNFHQSVGVWMNVEGTEWYYAWTDADGTMHYFYQVVESQENQADTQIDGLEGRDLFQDEDGLGLTLGVAPYSAEYTTDKYIIIDKQGNKSFFDSLGRLIKMENNQQIASSITIAYDDGNADAIERSLRISKVVDGAGREYRFSYSADNLLTRIGYYGTGTTEVSHISFAYANNQLTAVTDQDGKTSTYGYENGLLTSAADIDGYAINYTYNGAGEGKPSRVNSVSETHGQIDGSRLTFNYAGNLTTITDHNGVSQILRFNNWGNPTSVQDEEGRAQFVEYYEPEDVQNKGNQLKLSSKLQNTVVNLLQDSSFENGTLWTADAGLAQAVTTDYAYLGAKALKVQGQNLRVTATTMSVSGAAVYTFSAYVKTGANAGAYLSIDGGVVPVTSEELSANQDWTRLEVTYRNESETAQTVDIQVVSTSTGPVYIDCAQLEQTDSASRYNIIENGDFRFGANNWIMSEKCNSDETVVETEIVNEHYNPATPLTDTHAFQIVGDPTSKLRIRQELPVGGNAGDTYVLAGWALGQGVPLTEQSTGTRTYTLRGQFLYTDGDTGVFEFDFNPSTDANLVWQYVSGVMVAEKDYSGIKIQVLFDYAANKVYFDGIQLFKESFGSSYTYDENGNVTVAKNVLDKTTNYEYDANNNLTTVTPPTGAEINYTYDNYHNVETATTAEGVVYTYEYDGYGNNTSIAIAVGDVKIESKVKYESDGNRIKSTTDAAGNVTEYRYNPDTNVLEWTQAPGETETTRTNYTYDAMYRLANVSANVDGLSEGTALTAAYTYTNDLLTALQTGSTTYSFTYGDFALRTGVSLGSRNLATYSYTKDAETGIIDKNHYLEKLDYGNDDSVQYSYDKYGRLVAQTYEDGATVTYRFDSSGQQSSVYDSASDSTTRYYYDFAGRLCKYSQTSPYAAHSVAYTFDELSNITAQKETINGVARTTDYTYDDDNRITSVAVSGNVRNYTYDSYGRLTQRLTENAFGNQMLTESCGYRTVSAEALTGQVSSHTLQYGDGTLSNFSYAYDEKGNITRIVSFGETTFQYDSQGQLIRENNQAANRTWTYQYDNAGNIVYKREYAYTTGELGTPVSISYRQFTDPSWGDLMTVYNGTQITYDTIGNPLSDGTWTYAWEHGRQLASMSDGTDTWDYEYDANGMRIRRSDGTTTYTYVYNGGLLSQMTKGADTLRFIYDASGSPMILEYGNERYYYVTNMQGDVVAILNAVGAKVVEYRYDAWGNIFSTTGSMASTLGQLNPLRYRGYVYDQETNLYYLKSRYYNPQWGRFLNADSFASTGQGLTGNNMFAYCGNDPINFADTAGTRREYVRDIAAISHYVPVVGSSDGKMDSDGLLQHLKEQGAGNTGDTYRYTVQYVGVYSKTTDYTADYARLAIAGGVLVASFIPCVREVAWVSIAMQAHSVVEFFASGVDLYHKSSDSLPDKDYHQYRVTLSYYEDTQYNGRTYRTVYDYEVYYLWNDASYSNPYWHMQKGVNNSRSYYVD